MSRGSAVLLRGTQLAPARGRRAPGRSWRTNPTGHLLVLSRGSRMRRRQDFTLAVRQGRRVGRRHVVVYLYERPGLDEVPRVGFIVGKAVGGAVVRNRVRRQLRHLVRERAHRLPTGSLLVVRASFPAAGARSGEFARELDSAFERLLLQQTGS